MPDFTPDDIDIDSNESNDTKKPNPQDITFWESLDYLKK